ncbi:O-methyltransferase [Croceifilum oryzae]|uniref:O-methyltransferase n=1 Tax=Croceifilum oryzae TaxID=1553429 RepID=A0AAJ1WSN4_9BACL|nr:O-methyltransferase [Croceifilum oryzae]
MSVSTEQASRELYLELLKKAILFEIYLEHEHRYVQFLDIAKNAPISPTKENRQRGLDWPPIAHSMTGRERMNFLHQCMNAVMNENIEGDFVETGVWRGGSCIFMRGFLKSHGITDRKIWVADSFEGLPAPDPQYPGDAGLTLHEVDFLRVSVEEVMENFKKYDLLDSQVTFLKGWFKDTLPVAPIEKIAIARLDGDMYSSTTDALVNLYHKVSVGGYVIIDDYTVPMCQQAVHDFRNKFNITESLIGIDGCSAFWKKTKEIEVARPTEIEVNRPTELAQGHNRIYRF